MKFTIAVILFAIAPSAVEGQTVEQIADIRVHGNHTTPDEDVLALAGLKIGDAATAERLAEAEARLRDSNRFEAVEVRRRYQSIADASQILVILLVDERPGVTSDVLIPGPARRLRAAAMWLPERISLNAKVTMAIGTLEARYTTEYHDYRLATATIKVR